MVPLTTVCVYVCIRVCKCKYMYLHRYIHTYKYTHLFFIDFRNVRMGKEENNDEKVLFLSNFDLIP